jgi:hypothetical protein
MEQSYIDNQNIDTMNSNQLLQHLQQSSKYHGLSRKQIVEQLGSSSVYVLRPELKKVLNNIVLPKDAWEEILLATDKLKDACLVNKNTVNICKDVNFWKKKFSKYELPFDLVDQKSIYSIGDWIKTFDKLLYSKFEAQKLTNLFTHLLTKHPEYPQEIFYYTQDNESMKKVIPGYNEKLDELQILYNKEEDEDTGQFVLLIRFDEGEITMAYYFENVNGFEDEGIFGIQLSLKDLYNLFIRWEFYINNKTDDIEDLVDENGFSYFYDPLLTNMNYTFISNTDRQQRQYKLLKTRLDYLKTYE